MKNFMVGTEVLSQSTPFIGRRKVGVARRGGVVCLIEMYFSGANHKNPLFCGRECDVGGKIKKRRTDFFS